MAKKKAKAKKPGTKSVLNAALNAAEDCCLALDAAYVEFTEHAVTDVAAFKKARKSAEKVLTQLENLL